jgi:hypothetical protein
MKKRLILRVYIPVLLILWAPLKVQATIYNDNGSATTYNLLSGDVLNINAGTYQGTIEKFEKGAVIKVLSTATFKPTEIKFPHGKIINSGVTYIDFPGDQFSPLEGFEIDNYGILRIIDKTFTHSTQTWVNQFGATIEFKAKVEINAGSDFKNNGTIQSENDFIIQANTNFLNNNIINVKGEVSFNGGISDNKGEIQAKGSIYYSIAATHANSCRLLTEGDFQISYGLTNDGFILLKGNGANKTFRNFGTSSLIQLPNSIIKTRDFINYGTISGSGSFYFTENSYNFGTVGSSTGPGVIRVFEATRVNPSGTFDYNWGGVIHSNVNYAALPDPAEDLKPSGCSPLFGAIVLPIKWIYFQVIAEQEKAILSWKASFDDVKEFIVERSTDNRSFQAISTITATTDQLYSFTDNKPQKGTITHYRIKAVKSNGKIEYSEIRNIRLANTNNNLLQISPNPTLDVTYLSVNMEKKEAVQLTIWDANGLLLTSKEYSLNAGVSKIEIPNSVQLKAGTYIIEIRSKRSLIGSTKLLKQ